MELPTLKGFEWELGQKLYLKPTHSIPQQLFLRLDDEDYEGKLKRAWTVEAKRLNDTDKVVVDLFAYLTDAQIQVPPQPRIPTPGRQDTIRKSSQRRIQEENGRIELAIDQETLNPMGFMSRAYFARNLAKRTGFSRRHSIN
jgi:hypothetical protein